MWLRFLGNFGKRWGQKKREPFLNNGSVGSVWLLPSGTERLLFLWWQNNKKKEMKKEKKRIIGPVAVSLVLWKLIRLRITIFRGLKDACRKTIKMKKKDTSHPICLGENFSFCCNIIIIKREGRQMKEAALWAHHTQVSTGRCTSIGRNVGSVYFSKEILENLIS